MKTFKIIAIISLLLQSQYAISEVAPIRIGATLALSGNLSFIGTAQQKGFELAKEEINRNGGIKGRPLEVISEDNTGDATQALTGVKKLLLGDKADIIFSSFTHVTQAIKTEVKQSEKLLLYQSTLSSIAKESPTFLKDYADSFSGGEIMGKTSNNKNYKNVSIFSEQNDACNEVVKGIKSTLNTSTQIVSEEIFNHGDTDLKPSLIKIKSKKPDALLICAWRDSALLMPQLKNLGMLKTPTIQYLAPFLPVSDTPELRKLFEENKTVSGWIGFTDGSLNAEQKTFSDNFQAKYGELPRLESLMAYDEAMILKSAIEKCHEEDKATDAMRLSQQIAGHEFKGISGTITFDQDGISNRENLMITIKDGKWVKEPA